MGAEGSESIRSFTMEQLEGLAKELGQPRFRAKQLHEWLHGRNASSYDEMTNLPKALREELQRRFPLQEASVAKVQQSRDGTRKYLLRLGDGAVVECVGILDGPADRDGGEEAAGPDGEMRPHRPRLTACVSTQVGCAMGCTFCATGRQGLARNLTADEITAQVDAIGRDFSMRVGNVVVMGQGEPFQNYDATLEAMRRLNGDAGFDIGARHITVSTSGLCEGIRRLAREPEQFRLAVSLHSADQDTRNAIMPRLSGENLKKLRNSLLHYCEQKGRRVTLEYMLLDQVNDSPDDLQDLVEFCEGLNVHVNLLPFNAVEGIAYLPSGQNVANRWKAGLEQAGIPCSLRRSKGTDISGACGQLITS